MPDDASGDSRSGSRSLGHVGLHYGPPEDGPTAAKLLRLLGFQETQMLPLPQGNFYRFVVDPLHLARGDGIIFLSALPQAQQQLIEAIHGALRVGTAQEHAAVRSMREMLVADPESSFHIGFLASSLEALEESMLILLERIETDPELRGRVRISMNRPRPGIPEIDMRLDASPLFGDVARYAYGQNGVQVFIETDLLKAGQLGDSAMLEFDYVFPNCAAHILSDVEI